MKSKSKNERILSLYNKIITGDVINKSAEAEAFGVNERSIQRDIDDIRAFFCNSEQGKTVKYERSKRGYVLADEGSEFLTNSEILAVCKILLESRSLVKEEMMPILDKLVNNCVPEQSKKKVVDLISNEKFHYSEPHHGVKFVDKLWDIGTAIQKESIIEVEYKRLKGNETVKRRLKPAAIMVSEFYFYLAAFIDNIDKEEHFENPDDLFPTIYRIDRIKSYKVTDEHFYMPYKNRFEEGEFRKRIQFMYGGKLQKIKFKYTGMSLEAVLDRLPTARILKEDSDGYIIEAETFGKGIEMWLKSQGENIERRSNL